MHAKENEAHYPSNDEADGSTPLVRRRDGNQYGGAVNRKAELNFNTAARYSCRRLPNCVLLSLFDMNGLLGIVVCLPDLVQDNTTQRKGDQNEQP